MIAKIVIYDSNVNKMRIQEINSSKTKLTFKRSYLFAMRKKTKNRICTYLPR